MADKQHQALHRVKARFVLHLHPSLMQDVMGGVHEQLDAGVLRCGCVGCPGAVGRRPGPPCMACDASMQLSEGLCSSPRPNTQ